jgi:hypothetical protein
MADTKPKKTAPKLFDVSRPGKSAPSSTSRPVIITNRPVLKDPMVIKVDTGEDNTATTETSASSSEMKHKVDIQPLHIDLSEVLPPSAPEVKKDSKKADDKPAEEKVEVETPLEDDKPEEETPAKDEKQDDKVAPTEPEEPATDNEEPKDDAESVTVKVDKPVDKPADNAPKTTGEKVIAPPVHDTEAAAEPTEKPAEESPAPETPTVEEDSFTSNEDEPSLDNNDRPVLSEKEAKATEAAKKKAEEQEKIIASGEFYLPINSVEKRRTRRNMILGLLFIVILVAIAALAAWDAGIFSIPGYQAPTNYL